MGLYDRVVGAVERFADYTRNLLGWGQVSLGRTSSGVGSGRVSLAGDLVMVGDLAGRPELRCVPRPYSMDPYSGPPRGLPSVTYVTPSPVVAGLHGRRVDPVPSLPRMSVCPCVNVCVCVHESLCTCVCLRVRG